jgi:hypothetical protein
MACEERILPVQGQLAGFSRALDAHASIERGNDVGLVVIGDTPLGYQINRFAADIPHVRNSATVHSPPQTCWIRPSRNQLIAAMTTFG